MARYRTGASWFILSRLMGATARIYVVLNVVHVFTCRAWASPSGSRPPW